MPKPRRRRIVLSGTARSRSVSHHAPELKGRIELFLRVKGAQIAGRAAELYAAAQKADDDKIKKILKDLGLDDWGDLSIEVRAALIAIYQDGGASAVKALGTDEGPDFFNRLNDRALAYAESRSAELVGMKYVDGELIVNPRAEYAITDTTRDGLRSLLEQAFTDGATPQSLSDAIQDSYDFSGARADVIARTELAFAHTAGEIEAMKASGVVTGKELIPSDSHEPDDCDDYFDQVFDLDDDEADPPIHPACECGLSYVVAEQEEAA